jgi:hypothetical protein
MPDLTRHTTRTCPSNIGWSTKIKSSSGDNFYNVYFANGDYTCNCKAYLYSKNNFCKHIKEADEKRCKGLSDAFANMIYEDEFCPDCGEKTVPFEILV